MSTTLEFSLFFFFFFFFFSYFPVFLPHVTVSAGNSCDNCPSTCAPNDPAAPLVNFPFQIITENYSADPHCGYPKFVLSCNAQQQTILTLPSSGEFIVKDINYTDQTISIEDPKRCLPKRYLEHDMSLTDSSFNYQHSLQNYTFLNCTRGRPPISISCLSGDDYNVIARLFPLWAGPDDISSSSFFRSNCSVITTASLPIEGVHEFYFNRLPHYSLRLKWDVPDCRSCVALGKQCALRNPETLLIQCIDSASEALRRQFRASVIGVVTSVASLWMLCMILTRTRKCHRRGNRRQQEPSNLSSSLELTTGLDAETIESYPMTQLGESPNSPSNDTCTICLCEYHAMDILTTIPQCNHHFHSICISEWLRKNSTCPLCRN